MLIMPDRQFDIKLNGKLVFNQTNDFYTENVTVQLHDFGFGEYKCEIYDSNGHYCESTPASYYCKHSKTSETKEYAVLNVSLV